MSMSKSILRAIEGSGVYSSSSGRLHRRLVSLRNLGLIAACFTFLAIDGPCRAQATKPGNEQSEGMETWRTSMARTPVPKRGCFDASYPSNEWTEVTCIAAPPPHTLAAVTHFSGIASSLTGVGGGTDFAAKSSGLISRATGSFPSVTGVTSEFDLGNIVGTNTFSLQLNANSFPTSLCQGCAGWQQFIFVNYPGQPQSTGVFMQYWLLNASSCPPSWTFYQGAGGGTPGCYRNSPMTPVSPVSIAQLGSLSLYGQAQGGTDTLILFMPPNHAFTVAQGSVLNLQNYWNAAEFNVFGASGSSALFNGGTAIVVQTSINDGTMNVPTCLIGFNGSTAETNNLTLMPTPQPICLPAVGTITFLESNTGSVAPPVVHTGAASPVTNSTAHLVGSVNPNGSETLAWYEYSTIGSTLNCYSPPTLTLPTQFVAGSGTAPVEFYADISGLTLGTRYYFVACALSPGGLVEGPVTSFVAIQAPVPSVNSTSVVQVTSSTATLIDTVNPNGFDTQAWFQYGTGSLGCGLVTATPSQDVGAGTMYATFSANISGLSPNTTYRVGACASNAGGVAANFIGTFTTLPFTTQLPSIQAVTSAASASITTLAPLSIATMYGTNLALPTNLGATWVGVKDSTGELQAAGLSYVSPGQVNFYVPEGTAPGTGTVIIIIGSAQASATVQLASVSPGIFQLNPSGLAAAEVIVVGPGGVQRFENVYQVNSAGTIVAMPISLTAGQVYLSLYGTGLRNAKTVTAAVGGASVPVQSSGAQGQFAGLDQVNIGPLPLSVSGTVNVIVTADGRTSNVVNVLVQ
jgi:uncharacterized protein (TIGR03437 family)